MKPPDFSRKTAVIVCHDAMFGPPHELRDYLLAHRIKRLIFIGHRNRSVPDNHITSSYCDVYESGRLTRHVRTRKINLPELVAYVRDSWFTLFWSFTLTNHIDIFVGLGNLNAFAGIILRSFGKVSRAVYYVIDYIPDRYGTSLTNVVYRRLDAFCAARAITWNYAPAMIRARENAWGRKFPRQFVVPNGVHVRPGVMTPFDRIHKKEVVYVGTLTEQQGAQRMITALPEILRTIPQASFCLIGRGQYRRNLEHLAMKLGVARRVRFLGFIADPVAMDKRLSKGALGIATYHPKMGFVRYTEPGKVKRYLSVGVPVVMTAVSPLGREIEQKRCGFVTPYDAHALAKIVISFLTHERVMREYRKNAVAFAKNFLWQTIFTNAFASMGE